MKYSVVSVRVKDSNLDLFGDYRAAADAINKSGGDAGLATAFYGENYERDLQAAKDWAEEEISTCHPDIAKNLIIDVDDFEDEDDE